MTLGELESKLAMLKEKYGADMQVILHCESDGPHAASGVEHRIAEEDEYPADYNMHEGFEYIEISGY